MPNNFIGQHTDHMPNASVEKMKARHKKLKFLNVLNEQ